MIGRDSQISTIAATRAHASAPPYARPDLSSHLTHRRTLSDTTSFFRPALLDYSTIPSEAYQRQDDNKNETFLRKLWCFVLEHEQQDSKPVIYWSRTRRYLLIPDEARLVREVAVVLFNQKDYSSFARQLNIYNFKRCSQSQIRELRDVEGIPDGCKVWVHPFLHGESLLSELNKVKRHATSKKPKTSSGSSLQSSSSSRYIPQFGVPEFNMAYQRHASPRPSNSGDTSLTSSPQGPSYTYDSFTAAYLEKPQSSLKLQSFPASLQRHDVPSYDTHCTPRALPLAPNERSFNWPSYRPGTSSAAQSPSNASTTFASSRACASAQLGSAASPSEAHRPMSSIPAFQLEEPVVSSGTREEQPRSRPDRRTSLEHLVDAALTA